MRQLLLVALASALAMPAQAQGPTIREALDGVDTVVLLREGKEVFGKSDFSVERAGFRYLFSTAETKAEFERQPERFEIQLEGQCAFMGRARGNPSDYLVHDGRIYIFGSDDCRKRFAAAPARYLEPPLPPMPTGSGAVAAGRALLDRIIAAHGGTPRLTALRTYRERTTQVQPRPTGDVPITSTVTWQYPFAAVQERTMANPAMPAPMTSRTVLNGDAGWNTFQDRVFVTAPRVVRILQLDLLRHPLAILKLVQEPGTAVAALEPATIEGTRVERVRVQRGGLDVVLAAEAASGRVHSIAFQDRNMENEVGTYTLVYADMREVKGLLVPHAMRALFNGRPDAFQTWTIEAVDVNPSVDPATFERPKGGQ